MFESSTLCYAGVQFSLYDIIEAFKNTYNLDIISVVVAGSKIHDVE